MQHHIRPAVESISVNIPGARMHMLRAGAGSPFLLIHGLVGSSENWLENIGALAQDRTVYAIDECNMGKSQRVASLDAGLEATADRLAAALDALGLDQADIAGHSHGGAVALMLAARHPERVRSLILFAPANPFSYPADRLVRLFSTSLGRLVAHSAPYLPKRLQQAGLDRMFGDPARVPDGSLEAYVRDLRVPGTMCHILEIVRNWFADMAKLEAALARIPDIPALLVWGDRDRAVDPASAVGLQHILQRSELHIVPGAGHILFEEMPEQINSLMLQWLRRDFQVSPIAGHQPFEPALRPSSSRSAPVPTHAGMQQLSPEV